MQSRYKTTMTKYTPGVTPDPEPVAPEGKWRLVSTELQSTQVDQEVRVIYTWEKIGPDDYLTQDL